MENFAVIILAAGGSSRLGKPKQLLVHDGTSFLEHAVQTASAIAGENVIVVLGANAKLVLEQVPALQKLSVINENWKEGMGTSIAIGLESVLDLLPTTTFIIIMTVDQPSVSSDHLQEMIRVYEQSGKSIVASTYDDVAGIPALFSHEYFKDLLNLKTDKGARDIIRSKDEQVAKIVLPGGEFDIDTPEQYAAFQNKRN
ncbi:MAG: nucleotidyltransferase family protein [Chitinophagaceae bacterium]|nr:MAG: nucleotidyltransferase family protein [Chitinophagaceae bacterium]